MSKAGGEGVSQFKGLVVEESLDSPLLVNRMRVTKVDVSLNPTWHTYTVTLSRDEIHQLQKHLKPRWYAHFWKGNDVIAIFKDKSFEFDHAKKESWKDAVEFGVAQGIPREQLDFPIS